MREHISRWSSGKRSLAGVAEQAMLAGPWHTLYDAIRSDLIVASACSMASSIILLLLYFSLPRVRRTPGWLLARAAGCEGIVSACFLSVWMYEKGPHGVLHDAVRSLCAREPRPPGLPAMPS